MDKGKNKVGEGSIPVGSGPQTDSVGEDYRPLDLEIFFEAVQHRLTEEMTRLFAIEKNLMKDEIKDELIAHFRNGGRFPSPPRTSPIHQSEQNPSFVPSQSQTFKDKSACDPVAQFAKSSWEDYDGLSDILTDLEKSVAEKKIGKSSAKCDEVVGDHSQSCDDDDAGDGNASSGEETGDQADLNYNDEEVIYFQL